MSKNICVVTGVHGDERQALAVGQRLTKLYPQITHILANPDAVAAKKRYLETDLNRSFSANLPISREEVLARKIKQELVALKPQVIIDIHNTEAAGTTCAIVTVEPTQSHKSLAAALGLSKIVVMPPSGSLISAFNETQTVALSVEIANSDKSYFKPTDFAHRVANLGFSNSVGLISIYEFVSNVKRATLERVGIEMSEIENFRQLSQGQKSKLNLSLDVEFSPIFAGGRHMGADAFTLVRSR